MELSLPEKTKFDEDLGTDLANEVKFEYWELLPLEIRCMIAKETDVMTRFSLMFSSKSNYDVARSVPIKIESISVTDKMMVQFSEIDRKNKFISVQLKKYDPSEVITTVCFVEDYGGTMVRRYWTKNGEASVSKTMRLTDTNHYDASLLFLEKLMKLTNYQIDAFRIEVDYGRYNLEFLDKLLIKKELYVNASEPVYLNSWLDTANSPLEKLGIYIPMNGYDYPSFFDRFNLKHDTIKNSRMLMFTNEGDSPKNLDFLELKCDKFDVYAPEVTPERVNQFVKKWINGDAPANFSRADFSGMNFHTYNENERLLLSGIDYTSWRHEYRIGNKCLSDFLDTYEYDYIEKSDCYYIETKNGNNGAALVFGEQEVLFLVTGKQN